jgi:hypothetical protein
MNDVSWPAPLGAWDLFGPPRQFYVALGNGLTATDHKIIGVGNNASVDVEILWKTLSPKTDCF